jgi:hypothetical protein
MILTGTEPNEVLNGWQSEIRKDYQIFHFIGSIVRFIFDKYQSGTIMISNSPTGLF